MFFENSWYSHSSGEMVVSIASSGDSKQFSVSGDGIVSRYRPHDRNSRLVVVEGDFDSVTADFRRTYASKVHWILFELVDSFDGADSDFMVVARDVRLSEWVGEKATFFRAATTALLLMKAKNWFSENEEAFLRNFRRKGHLATKEEAERVEALKCVADENLRHYREKIMSYLNEKSGDAGEIELF